jgi:hypothetical protein
MIKPRPIDDVIDSYQRRMAAMPTWTKKKRELAQELRKALDNAGFGRHCTRPASCFNLSGLGNDVIRSIPPKKRGGLQQWRGQTVRIVCIEPGRYYRGYAVGPTTKKPPKAD